MRQETLFDFGFEDVFGNTVEEDGMQSSQTKKAAESKASKKATKSKTSKKEEKVKLPCKVYGSGLYKEVIASDFGGKEEIPLKELEKYVAQSCSSVGDVLKLVPGEENIIAVAYKNNVSAKMDTVLNFHGTLPYTVVYGELRAEFFESDFSKENVTLLDVLKKWVELYPEFDGCEGIVLEKKSMIVPIFTNYVEISQELTLPVSIGLFEHSETFSLGVTGKEKKTVKELVGEYTEKHTEMTHFKNVNTLYAYCGKTNTIIPVITADNGKTVTTQYITLPVQLVFTFRPDRLELTSEQFENKKQVTLAEIQEFTSSIYKMFSKENSDFFYVEEDHLVVANRRSRTKGSEEVHIIKKIFTLIDNREKLEKALMAPYFLGFYQPEKDKNMYRVEKNGIGTFMCLVNPEGDIVEGVDCIFYSGLPKIPFSIFEQAVDYFKNDLNVEAAVQIWYNPKEKKYFSKIPEIIGVSKTKISFLENNELMQDNVLVMDLHSHNTMPAFFSGQDNSDERGCQLYGVVGLLNNPEYSVKLRAGCEGVYKNLKFSEIFESEV